MELISVAPLRKLLYGTFNKKRDSLSFILSAVNEMNVHLRRFPVLVWGCLLCYVVCAKVKEKFLSHFCDRQCSFLVYFSEALLQAKTTSMDFLS